MKTRTQLGEGSQHKQNTIFEKIEAKYFFKK
jgi:hypothetical protein